MGKTNRGPFRPVEKLQAPASVPINIARLSIADIAGGGAALSGQGHVSADRACARCTHSDKQCAHKGHKIQMQIIGIISIISETGYVLSKLLEEKRMYNPI